MKINNFNELLKILRCPDCQGLKIQGDFKALICNNCKRHFEITNNKIIKMLPKNELPLPEIYNNQDYLRWQKVSAEALLDYFEKGNRLFYIIHHSAHNAIDKFSKSINNNNDWILDLGCGAGAHYSYYKDLTKVIGLDNNLDSLNKIRQIYPDTFLIQGDNYFLPFQDQSIKQIISIYNLEHLYYLEEALKEIYRVLNNQGNFLAGLPCEGGFAWNMGRRFTSSRSLSKRYNLDYSKVIKIEHCNNIYKIINLLRKYFLIKKKKLFPFSFLSVLYFNLTVSFWMTKK